MRLGVIFVILAGFALTTSLVANTDGAIYMKYGDIKGDVVVSGFEETIACESISWGVSRTFSERSGGGEREASRPSFTDISCSKVLDSSSVVLFGEAAFGTATDEVKISFVTTGEKANLVFLEYKLTNVLVSSYSISGDADDRPSEHLTLNFEKIEAAYTPFVGDKAGPKVEAGYDLVAGKKV